MPIHSFTRSLFRVPGEIMHEREVDLHTWMLVSVVDRTLHGCY